MFSNKSKDGKTGNDTMAKQTSARPARPSANGTSPSIISADVRIEGHVTTKGELQLDGEVEGDIQCGAITMGDQGAVIGSIQAENAVIKGRVEGRIRAKQVRLEKSAHVDGDVHHESLSVEAGAQLTGQVVHASHNNARAAITDGRTVDSTMIERAHGSDDKEAAVG